jgi:carbon-monoxide dehydrogenase medium subunit
MQVPASFDYAVARSVDEALMLLKERGPDARVIAGGHSLLPMMKLRLASPAAIVDIAPLEAELRYIRADGTGLRVGALATHRDLLESALVRERAPLLVDAEHLIADPLVRNMGTAGGSIAHGDAAEDLAAAFTALDGIVSIRSSSGMRELPIDRLYLGPFTTALEEGELIVEIRWERPALRSAYVKVERRYGDYAAAALGVAFDLAPDGTLAGVRIGMCGVGSTTLRARNAQAFLEGKKPERATLAQAGRIAGDESEPLDDARGSAAYKRDLVRVLTPRAIERALQRHSAAGNGGANHAN